MSFSRSYRSVIGKYELQTIASTLAIDIDYKIAKDKTIRVLAIAKGGLFFAKDLAVALAERWRDVEFYTIVCSSYGDGMESSGEVKIDKTDLPQQVVLTDNDKPFDGAVLVVDDICDTGRTLERVLEHVRAIKYGNVVTCTLLDKPSRREVDIVPDFVGKVIPDLFVVGYGLGLGEKYRALSGVYIYEPDGGEEE